MKTNIPQEIKAAYSAIGHDVDDLPVCRLEAGRILLSVADNEEDEGDTTMGLLQAALPSWAKAEWTGSSDTDSAGETTSDIAITWYSSLIPVRAICDFGVWDVRAKDANGVWQSIDPGASYADQEEAEAAAEEWAANRGGVFVGVKIIG